MCACGGGGVGDSTEHFGQTSQALGTSYSVSTQPKGDDNTHIIVVSN
jgi:hypothetical protein